jgi:ABC-type multidrug transport system fused ATPase/permease subunit
MSSASIETLNTIETLLESEDIYGQSNIFKTSHAGFDCNIKLQNISFRYPDNPNLILDNISIQITSGESVAIVGKSGAGKTSLVDVLLGVIEPQEGTVTISGLKPKDAISKWPGDISYVPQDIQIINGTVRQNICLGYELAQIPEDAIWDALRVTQLEKLVKTLENGLDTYIGDKGSKWSGGERQRLGIARAIITQPKLLVMDESTSSLDGQTEHELASAILELKKNTTILLIAHRLSSIRSMEKIIYLDFGKIVSVGTFKKVREEVPDFEKQSQLMGL